MAGKNYLRQSHRVQVQREKETYLRAVVLCQNFGQTQSVWDRVVGILSRTGCYRVITYENMGSPRMNAWEYDSNHKRYEGIEPFAWDLIAILEAFGINSCFFVGHSLACMVGARASILKPDLFSKLFFINPTPRYVSDPNGNPPYYSSITQEEANACIRLSEANWQAFLVDGEPVAHLIHDINGYDNPDEQFAPIKELAEHYFITLREWALPHLLRNIFINIDERRKLGVWEDLPGQPGVPCKCYILKSRLDVVVPQDVIDFICDDLRTRPGFDAPVVVELKRSNNHSPHHLFDGDEVGSKLLKHFDDD